jgi:hypothetical protein
VIYPYTNIMHFDQIHPLFLMRPFVSESGNHIFCFLALPALSPSPFSSLLHMGHPHKANDTKKITKLETFACEGETHHTYSAS